MIKSWTQKELTHNPKNNGIPNQLMFMRVYK